MVTPEEYEQYEEYRLADKSVTLAVIVGVLFSPASYVYVGRYWLALLNLFTVNYFLTGFVVVPLHTWFLIVSARRRVDDDDGKTHPVDYFIDK